MRSRSTYRAVAAAGVLAFAAIAAAWAQESWEATLKLQLQNEKSCIFQNFVSVRQLPVERLDALEGRLRCVDGREFDFSRQKAHQKFEIHLCQPAVC